MIKSLVFLIILPLFVCSCVGPTSPFGAIDQVKQIKDEKQSGDREISSQGRHFEILFHPSRQVLHDKSDFSVELKSRFPLTDNITLQILYNNIDVTQAFLSSTSLHRSEDQRTRIYVLENFRLKTLDPNKIEVLVTKGKDKVLRSKNLVAPECSLFQKKQLANLGAFRAPAEFKDLIEKVAGHYNSNPSLLAGIVAQESGFDPYAVSWAKAIGLTQITPLAEEEVIDNLGDLPRYPGINSLSYLTLKTKIHMGEITPGQEWRLDPEKSLQGGMAYISYLQDYWNIAENKNLIESLEGDFETNLTELILASYNSGAARVKRAVKQLKNNWKEHEKLGEAAYYVKKVSSYCYHYTESKVEVSDDNET